MKGFIKVHTNVYMEVMHMKRFDLSGKVALVSGCSQGLGYACVLALARHGADIFGVSIGDDSELKKEVEELGRQYHSCTKSLTTPGAIDDVMKDVLAEYGKLDILLNFAGITRKEDTLQMNESSWNTIFDINVKAAFFLSQAAIKQFIKQGKGGKIINASSVLTQHSCCDYCAYTASKGGLEAMTKALANEFSHADVQVNAISFGYMTTGTSLQCDDEGHIDHSILDRIPAKRWGSYKDVDGLLLLLASSASNYISGAIIPVDGGYSIN